MYRVEIVELITDRDGAEYDSDAGPIAVVYAPTLGQARDDAVHAVAALRCGFDAVPGASCREPTEVAVAPCAECHVVYPAHSLAPCVGVDLYGNGPVGCTDNVLVCNQCEPGWFGDG